MTGRKVNRRWPVPDGFVSQAQAAERIGVGPSQISYWTDTGKLPPPAKYGRTSKIYPASVIDAMRRRREAGEPTPPGWWKRLASATPDASQPKRETFAERWARVRGEAT